MIHTAANHYPPDRQNLNDVRKIRVKRRLDPFTRDPFTRFLRSLISDFRFPTSDFWVFGIGYQVLGTDLRSLTSDFSALNGFPVSCILYSNSCAHALCPSFSLRPSTCRIPFSAFTPFALPSAFALQPVFSCNHTAMPIIFALFCCGTMDKILLSPDLRIVCRRIYQWTCGF